MTRLTAPELGQSRKPPRKRLASLSNDTDTGRTLASVIVVRLAARSMRLLRLRAQQLEVACALSVDRDPP